MYQEICLLSYFFFTINVEVAFIVHFFSTSFSSNQYIRPMVHAGLQKCIISPCTSVWCGMTCLLKTITMNAVHYTLKFDDKFSIEGPHHRKFQTFLQKYKIQNSQDRVVITSIFIAAVYISIELQGLCTCEYMHYIMYLKVLSYRVCVHAHICTI